MSNKDKIKIRPASRKEAIWFVNSYYSMHNLCLFIEDSLNSENSSNDCNNNNTLSLMLGKVKEMQKLSRTLMELFVSKYNVGLWLQSLIEIDDILATMLLVHLDIRLAKTACHFWRFCGLDPTTTKGQYNLQMKHVCSEIGNRIIKFQNHPKQFYGTHYKLAKDFYIQNNIAGKYASTCLDILRNQQEHNVDSYLYHRGRFTGAEFEAILSMNSNEYSNMILIARSRPDDYGVRMLTPNHVHLRARRKAVKLFLSHLHHVMFEDYYGKPPPLPQMTCTPERYQHYIPPPNWPLQSQKVLSLRCFLNS